MALLLLIFPDHRDGLVARDGADHVVAASKLSEDGDGRVAEALCRHARRRVVIRSMPIATFEPLEFQSGIVVAPTKIGRIM